MLNIEEELKTPIVASPAGRLATKFLIMHGDVVHVNILGQEINEELERPLAESDREFLKQFK